MRKAATVAATAPIHVCASADQQNVEFVNDEGHWTIFLACRGANASRNLSVGPGYIARFIDTRGGTPRARFVDGEVPPFMNNQPTHIADAGGLGIFGWHHARGVPNMTDAVTHGGQMREIDGEECAPTTGPPAGASSPRRS